MDIGMKVIGVVDDLPETADYGEIFIISGSLEIRKDWKAPDANDYEKSDVKIWLERWASEKGIMQKE